MAGPDRQNFRQAWIWFGVKILSAQLNSRIFRLVAIADLSVDYRCLLEQLELQQYKSRHGRQAFRMAERRATVGHLLTGSPLWIEIRYALANEFQ